MLFTTALLRCLLWNGSWRVLCVQRVVSYDIFFRCNLIAGMVLYAYKKHIHVHTPDSLLRTTTPGSVYAAVHTLTRSTVMSANEMDDKLLFVLCTIGTLGAYTAIYFAFARQYNLEYRLFHSIYLFVSRNF